MWNKYGPPLGKSPVSAVCAQCGDRRGEWLSLPEFPNFGDVPVGESEMLFI